MGKDMFYPNLKKTSTSERQFCDTRPFLGGYWRLLHRHHHLVLYFQVNPHCLKASSGQRQLQENIVINKCLSEKLLPSVGSVSDSVVQLSLPCQFDTVASTQL